MLSSTTRAGSLPRSTPRAESINSAGLLDFLGACEKENLELHSLMIVRHGKVVAEGWWEPYARHIPHLLYSLSKSFTSTALGLAVSESLLSLEDPIARYLPEAANYTGVSIADALRMSTGHLSDPVLDPTQGPVITHVGAAGEPANPLLEMLAQYTPERPPGEIFTYDQLASYAIAAIVERVSGISLLEYLQTRLFEPLGIDNARWVEIDGVNPGFSGLYLETEAIAKFGQLLLQRGSFNGQQILDPHWVAEATGVQMPTDSAHRYPAGSVVEPDSALGYGYQFWKSTHGYRGDGAFGQFCIVLPEQDTVIAITASTTTMQALLTLIWKYVVPSLEVPLEEGVDVDGDADVPASSDGDADVEVNSDAVLTNRLKSARLAPPAPGQVRVAQAVGQAAAAGTATQLLASGRQDLSPSWLALARQAQEASLRAEALKAQYFTDQKNGRTLAAHATHEMSTLSFVRESQEPLSPANFGGIGAIDLPEVEWIELKGNQLIVHTTHGVASVEAPHDRWATGALPSSTFPVPFSVRGGWSEDGAFEAELRMIQTPHVALLRLDPIRGSFELLWRESTLMGPGLKGYAIAPLENTDEAKAVVDTHTDHHCKRASS